MARAGNVGGKAAKAAPAKSKKKAPAAPIERKSAKELRTERFVAEYLIDYNGQRAAIAAGFSPKTARQAASQLLAMPEVQAQVQARQKDLVEKLEDMQVFVLADLMHVASADPRELSEHWRVACRYCWGKKHRYHRRASEREEAYRTWLEAEAAKAELDPPGKPDKFDELGGVGYSTNLDPNPECPECDGQGISHTVMKDTRDLSERGRRLYDGVEVTQHGIKIRGRSRSEAVLNIGKHFGMFAQKVKLGAESEGDAAKQYQVLGDILDLVNASDTGTGPARSRRSG